MKIFPIPDCSFHAYDSYKSLPKYMVIRIKTFTLLLPVGARYCWSTTILSKIKKNVFRSLYRFLNLFKVPIPTKKKIKCYNVI